MRWDADKPPTSEFLKRMMTREGLCPEQVELPANSRSPEMKFEQTRVLVASAGCVQVSFPGYGSVEVFPGDILEIQPHTTHDFIVDHVDCTVIYEAFK